MAYGAGVAVAAQDEDRPIQADNTEDWRIELAINRAWLDVSRSRFSSLIALVYGGTVNISGTIKSADDHIEALKVVWDQTGVDAVQSTAVFGAADTDRMLADAIRIRLTGDPAVRTNGYAVEVFNDDVYLLGRAISQAELNRVIRHARAAGNVRRVVTMVLLRNTDT